MYLETHCHSLAIEYLNTIFFSNTEYMSSLLNFHVAISVYTFRPTSIGIPIKKIRRSHDRLIFIMEVQYSERLSLYWDGAQQFLRCCTVFSSLLQIGLSWQCRWWWEPSSRRSSTCYIYFKDKTIVTPFYLLIVISVLIRRHIHKRRVPGYTL